MNALIEADLKARSRSSQQQEIGLLPRVEGSGAPNAVGFARHRFWLLAALFAGVLAPLALLGKIADEVREREAFRFDGPLLLWLHAHSSPFLDHVFLFFTIWGGARLLPVVVLLTVALWLRGQRGDAWFLLAAFMGAGALNVAAKHIFGRARPSLWISITPEHDFGFPSGHAMLSMALGAALVSLAWRTRERWPIVAAAAVFVFLVGLSRLYLGVHFPSDVLGGWLASLVWTNGVWLMRMSRRTSLFPKSRRFSKRS